MNFIWGHETKVAAVSHVTIHSMSTLAKGFDRFLALERTVYQYLSQQVTAGQKPEFHFAQGKSE